MTAATLRRRLVFAAFALALAASTVVLMADQAGATDACGPQQLVVTETTVSVTPEEGCEVDLVVWSGTPTEDCVKGADDVCVFVLPQNQVSSLTGTGPLTADLPCGWWQADVVETGTVEFPDVLTFEWLSSHPEAWLRLLGGVHGERVCTPEPPVLPPVPPVLHVIPPEIATQVVVRAPAAPASYVEELPRTGVVTDVLAPVGFGLVAAGALAVAKSRCLRGDG